MESPYVKLVFELRGLYPFKHIPNASNLCTTKFFDSKDLTVSFSQRNKMVTKIFSKKYCKHLSSLEL